MRKYSVLVATFISMSACGNAAKMDADSKTDQLERNISINKNIRNGTSVVYNFEGQINQESYEKFAAFVQTNHDKKIVLSIKSTGGNAIYAMKMGDLILGKSITLIIHTYCHSACSSKILSSSDNVTIAEGTSFGFHGSPALIQLPAGAPRKVKKFQTEFETTERLFYKRRAIDAQKLYNLATDLKPLCNVRVHSVAADDLNAYGTVKKYNVFVPSRSVMQELGFKIGSNYWPEGIDEVNNDAFNAGFGNRLSSIFVTRILDIPPSRERRPDCSTMFPESMLPK